MKFPLVLLLFLNLSFAFAGMKQKVYQNGKVNNIVSTPDGGYILTGFIYTNTTDKCLLMKFDSLGNPEWANSYSDLLELYSFGKQTVYLPGNGCLFTGTMFHDTISNEEITLAKTDTSGTLLWSREYGNPFDDDEVGSMLMTPDGILLGGHSSSFGPGGEDFYLIKTDSSGDLRWSKTFGTARDERGIILLPYQNGYVFGGYGKEATGNNNDIFLLFLDSSAAIINAVRLGLAGNQILHDIAVDPSGNVLVAATTETSSNAPHALFIKLSAGGNILWSKVLNTNYSIPHKISVVSDGCIVAGETRTQLFHENAFLFKMDDNGLVTSENYFGDSSGMTFTSFLTTNDSLKITGNFTRPAKQQTSVYVSTYSPGDTACNRFTTGGSFLDVFPSVNIDNWQTSSPATVQVNSIVLGITNSWSDSIVCDNTISVDEINHTFSFSLSPNPCQAKCVLTLPFENKETKISVLNSRGETIKNFTSDEKKILLSTGDLPSGVYSIRVTTKDFSATRRLIIQN